MNATLPTASDWQTSATKLKIKDNGVRTTLAAFDRLHENAHEDRIKVLASVSKLATALLSPFESALKKNKDDKAARAAADYLNGLVETAKLKQTEVAKDKALAAKTQALAEKAEAEAKNKGQSGDEEDDELGDAFDVLKRTIQSLRQAKLPYYFQVCDVKPYGLIISKRDIRKSAQHRKQLAQIAGGSTRPPKVGECHVEGSKLFLEMQKPPSGLARILQKWIKDCIGLALKVQVGTQTGDDDEQPAEAPAGAKPIGAQAPPGPGDAQRPGPQGAATAEGPAAPAAAEPAVNIKAPFTIGASVGQRGKNSLADVQAVQTALNNRAKAGLVVDGRCGPKTIAAIMNFQRTIGMQHPDGLVEPGKQTERGLKTGQAGAPEGGPQAKEAGGAGGAVKPPENAAAPKLPPPRPELLKAPELWHKTRRDVEASFDQIKAAIRKEYAGQAPALLADIEKNITKLDGVLAKLDKRLADSLVKAREAKDAATQSDELKNSNKILKEYLKYVISEGLFAKIDANPFGVQTNVKQTLVASLNQMARAVR